METKLDLNASIDSLQSALRKSVRGIKQESPDTQLIESVSKLASSLSKLVDSLGNYHIKTQPKSENYYEVMARGELKMDGES